MTPSRALPTDAIAPVAGSDPKRLGRGALGPVGNPCLSQQPGLSQQPVRPAQRREKFTDRRSAGRELAQALRALSLRAPLVLALPRGGVPVAAEVAQALDAPLDLLLVRKIGAPAQPELAVAAVAALADSALPSQTVLDPGLMLASDADQTYVEHGVSRERLELERRRLCYLRGRKALPMAGHTVIVVDDGVATGTTARAALKALRALPPEQAPDAVVLAVPVAPDQALQALAREVDAVVCLWAPAPFFAVGAHYRSFPQVSDEQVSQALNPEPGA